MGPLDHANAVFCRMERNRKPDGMGGFETIWSDGPEFPALMTLDTSTSAMQAQKQGVESLYSIMVDPSVELAGLDYIKRSDGKVFQITTDPNEKVTPAEASFAAKEFRAKETVLPT